MLKEKNLKSTVIANEVKQSHQIATPYGLAMTEQSGRSMVEMLGVLAVIGVLSVAGIAGYTTAMRNHRANEVVNAASMLYVMAQAKNQGNGADTNYTELGTPPSGITLEYSASTKAISITFNDEKDCTVALNKLGDKAEGTCAAGSSTLTVKLGEAGATNTPERNCWLTNDCTADDAKPGESWCDGGLHLSDYCSDMENCLGIYTLEQCRNLSNHKDADKGFTDCRKTGKDISYCKCLLDYDKTYCDCMEEGKDQVCCICLFGSVMSRCYVACKYDPEGYTGPTSAVSDGTGCYYSDDQKYACGQYNGIYRCDDNIWHLVGYTCTDGCEDNGRHDNPDDTCKNKKKGEMV